MFKFLIYNISHLNLNQRLFIGTIILLLMGISCSKDSNNAITPKGSIKQIAYLVRGSNFSVSYIDSNSIYRANQVFKDSFNYTFKKGSGAGIGLAVHPQSSSDTVYSWSIMIDGKLYANAFSEGGAFLSVPYDK